ncbi:hypothetical protein BSKO_07613 [Bryopsis sp. KO-2023]|nr:hypothetical protein BSKO_07613 [Bryopsis sp. KO-2023]
MISARKTVYLRVFVCSFPFHDFMKTKLCILLDQPYFSLSDCKRDVIAGRGSHALALALALDVRKRRADGTEDVLSLSEQVGRSAVLLYRALHFFFRRGTRDHKRSAQRTRPCLLTGGGGPTTEIETLGSSDLIAAFPWSECAWLG